MLQGIRIFLAIMGGSLVLGGLGLLVVVFCGRGRFNERSAWKRALNLLEVLERPRRIERIVYRHHRLFGGITIFFVLIFLALFGTWYLRSYEISIWHTSFGAQLAIAAVWMILIFALIIGVYVLVRPSALKGIEAWANRWIEPFRVVPRIDR